MSFAQLRTMRTISAAASGVPSPRLVGSTPLRSFSLHKHLRQRNWAKLSWARLRHLLPWLWFLGTTIKWGNRGRRPQFRCAVWNHCPGPGAYPLFRPSNCRHVSIAPTTGSWLGLQHNSPGHSFHQLCRCFAAACLTASHCIFIRAISCTSAAVCVFCGGFNTFEEPVDVLLYDTASSPSTSSGPLPMQSGRACVGRAAASAAQVQASSVRSQAGQSWPPSRVSPSGVVPQPASTCPSIRATRLVPLRASDGCDVCVSPTAGAQLCCQHDTPWPCVSPASGGENFTSSLFDRCTLHFDPRNLPFVCVNSNQRVNLSGSLYVWRCACVCLDNLQSRTDVAGVPLVRGAHRVRLQCALLQGVSAVPARTDHSCQHVAHVQAQEFGPRAPSLPMQRASLLTVRLPFGAAPASVHRRLHARRHHKPAPAVWDPTRPIGLQQPQPGGIQDHVAWSIGGDSSCDAATAS